MWLCFSHKFHAGSSFKKMLIPFVLQFFFYVERLKVMNNCFFYIIFLCVDNIFERDKNYYQSISN